MQYPGPARERRPRRRRPTLRPTRYSAIARLNRLVDLALANNRDLRTAVLNVQQTQAQYRITRSALFPTVQGSASCDPLETSFATARSGAGSVPIGSLGRRSASSLSYTANSFSASVGVTSYELDLFGHVRSQTAQALEQYFQTEEAQRAAQVSLVGQVATQYLTLRETEELLKLSQDTLAAVQASYDLNKATVRCRRQQ